VLWGGDSPPNPRFNPPTTIYVTHDQVEAMTMGDRVVVMRKGEVQQVAPPQAIYEEPANLFVATFIGSPPMNLLRATLVRDGDRLAAVVGTQRLELPPQVAPPSLARYAGGEIGIGVRPEHVQDAALGGGDNAWRLGGTVSATELLGSDLLVYLEIDAEPIVTPDVIEVAADIDAASVDALRAEADRSRTPLVCRFDARSTTRVDEAIVITFPPERVHFFELETGLAIRG
jgi:multiple sugar transport system ATP-binding protein